jgi:hypothetical protein
MVDGSMLFPTTGSTGPNAAQTNGAAAIVTDPALCAQIKIPSVLKFVLGEWILDTSEGFPWRTIWGQKSPDLFSLKQLIRKTLLGITVGMPPIASIVDLATTYDAALRNLLYQTSVKLSTGQIVTVGSS